MEELRPIRYWLKHSNKERVNCADLLRYTEENNIAPLYKAEHSIVLTEEAFNVAYNSFPKGSGYCCCCSRWLPAEKFPPSHIAGAFIKDYCKECLCKLKKEREEKRRLKREQKKREQKAAYKHFKPLLALERRIMPAKLPEGKIEATMAQKRLF